MPHPAERPAPDVAAIVCALARHEVDWVLTGSAVLVAYGADLRPGDLDVVVDPKPANLARLAALLVRIQAVPAYFRDWLDGPTLRQCLNWTPEPVSASRLDHRFVTDLGMLDLPPEITGCYARLRPRATGVELCRASAVVVRPNEVLARLDGRTRAKSLRRARIYARLRTALLDAPDPEGLTRLAPIG